MTNLALYSNFFFLWYVLKYILIIVCNPPVMQVESSDLISYGLIPEFVGRFPILVSLSALTEDQLVQVMINVSRNLALWALIALCILL